MQRSGSWPGPLAGHTAQMLAGTGDGAEMKQWGFRQKAGRLLLPAGSVLSGVNDPITS